MPAILKTATLGCKVNQYETQYVREGLLGIGYREALPGEKADLCLVNTCTVTSEGDAKSRQLIRRLARENPTARIVVMGCYAARVPDEVARLPGVAEVIADKRELPEFLSRLGVVDIPTGISRFGTRHRAYVKVQDGCLLRCSYCIIPTVRPILQSRPIPQVLDEVRRLLDNGYREIVLTGVHLGHFGVDLQAGRPKSQWVRLADLVRAIVAIEGDFRVRLSSLEATEITHELVRVIAETQDKICPHLHICLQSGSDAVLRRMQRRGGIQQFLDRCRAVTDQLDLPALTTDVMVGFPGETEDDFEATCRVAREVGFSKMHIFPFSPRQGTPAAVMPARVPQHIVAERAGRLTVLERDLRLQYFQRLVGRRLKVLVEHPSDTRAGWYVGTSCRYAPVELPTAPQQQGQLVDVIVLGTECGRVVARETGKDEQFDKT